eukprot:SAG31_NODE_229_length_19770_cov_9.887194_8_plen_173_part_00
MSEPQTAKAGANGSFDAQIQVAPAHEPWDNAACPPEARFGPAYVIATKMRKLVWVAGTLFSAAMEAPQEAESAGRSARQAPKAAETCEAEEEGPPSSCSTSTHCWARAASASSIVLKIYSTYISGAGGGRRRARRTLRVHVLPGCMRCGPPPDPPSPRPSVLSWRPVHSNVV